MMCPNKNHPDWKEMVEEYGKIEAFRHWLKGNYSVTEAKKSDQSKVAETPIKEGVAELFESNPELANSVYEALGFKDSIIEIPNKYELNKEYNLKSVINNLLNTENESINNIYKVLLNSIPSNLKLIYTKNIKQNANGQYNYLEDVIKLNINKLSHKTLIHEIIHALTHDTLLKNEEFNNKITALRKQAIQYFENNRPKAIQGSTKYALTSNDEFLAGLFNYKNLDFLNTLNNIPSENTTLLEKIKNVFKNLINEIANIAGIKLNENSLLYEVINELGAIKIEQITQQQKQKAQELYSQYLDTVFPDSKVKDIVYHITYADEKGNLSFDKFDINLSSTEAIYFLADKNNTSGIGNVRGKPFPFLINITNPNVTPEVDINIKKIRYEGDGVIIRPEYLKGEDLWYAVFEPEQIHILGSQKDMKGFKEFVGKTEKKVDNTIFKPTSFEIQKQKPSTSGVMREFKGRSINEIFEQHKEALEQAGITLEQLKHSATKNNLSNEEIEKWLQTCLGSSKKGSSNIRPPMAEQGMKSSKFTKGGKWKLIKDLKGYPTHEKGGVDLMIGKDGVSITSGQSNFKAEYGLVLPKAQSESTSVNMPIMQGGGVIKNNPNNTDNEAPSFDYPNMVTPRDNTNVVIPQENYDDLLKQSLNAETEEYERFKNSLPDNLKYTDESNYNMRYLWFHGGKPTSFEESINRENPMFSLGEDGDYHGGSVEPNTLQFVKRFDHPTLYKELDWYNSEEGKDFRSKYDLDKSGEFYRYVLREKQKS